MLSPSTHPHTKLQPSTHQVGITNVTPRALGCSLTWIRPFCAQYPEHLPSQVLTLVTPFNVQVVGHGLNAQELARNPAFKGEFFVRNLNKEPSGWALKDQSMDAVLCCCRWVSRRGKCIHRNRLMLLGVAVEESTRYADDMR